jgi:DNA polymerase III delta subunit
MIAEFCLFDMNKINAEIAKLISYSAGSGEITEDDVENLVQKETDYKIYEVVGFIADKNYDKAYSVLKEMIDDGNGQVLLVSLYYHFRRLLHISLSDKSDAETAELLGVKEFAVKKSRMQARAFSPKRLMRINNKLIEYDEKFKSGEIALNQALLNAVFMILTEE